MVMLMSGEMLGFISLNPTYRAAMSRLEPFYLLVEAERGSE